MIRCIASNQKDTKVGKEQIENVYKPITEGRKTLLLKLMVLYVYVAEIVIKSFFLLTTSTVMGINKERLLEADYQHIE